MTKETDDLHHDHQIMTEHEYLPWFYDQIFESMECSYKGELKDVKIHDEKNAM